MQGVGKQTKKECRLRIRRKRKAMRRGCSQADKKRVHLRIRRKRRQCMRRGCRPADKKRVQIKDKEKEKAMRV